MATTGNTFVYWMDGIGGRAFDHHSRNGREGGGGGYLPTKNACRAGHFTKFFKCLGFAEGEVSGWN